MLNPATETLTPLTTWEIKRLGASAGKGLCLEAFIISNMKQQKTNDPSSFIKMCCSENVSHRQQSRCFRCDFDNCRLCL